jgi:hypothetical protein
MSWLLDAVLPLAPPSPFLAAVGACFAASGAVTVALALLIRYGWRRGKRLEDL